MPKPGEELLSLPFPGAGHGIAFSPEGHFHASAEWQKVMIFDAKPLAGAAYASRRRVVFGHRLAAQGTRFVPENSSFEFGFPESYQTTE
jgi:hypothetical protein